MTATEAVEVLVVGSGFGGAVTACRLAQAGHEVVVLERGRRWADIEFPRTMGEVGGAFWNDANSADEWHDGFLEYLAFPTVDVIQGVGVGGGSLHYFNVNLPAPSDVLDLAPWPPEITRSGLQPYYDAALDMLESKPLRPPVDEPDLPPRTRVFTAAAERAGHRPEAVPIAVHVGEERRHPVSGVRQRACTYCGNCLFGCHLNSKQTLDHNYLALAERNGARVLELHEATAISEVEGGYLVECRRRDRTTGEATSTRLRARRVVVAAGSLGSTQLLLRSRDLTGGLPRLPRSLGSRFSVNGEFLLARGQDVRPAAEAGIGPPITSMVSTGEGWGRVTVQDLGLPDQLLWFVEGATPPTTERLRRLAHLAAGYVGRTFGRGSGSRVSVRLDHLVEGARMSSALPYLGMGVDRGEGHMRLDGGRVELDWNPNDHRELYRSVQGLMEEISRAAGGRFVTSPLWRWPLRKVLTAHPLGGSPMSSSPRTGVVDHRAQVWGHDGLFVVDGSIIPTALAVNPSLTIAALAERAAFWMEHDRDLAAVDAAVPANR